MKEERIDGWGRLRSRPAGGRAGGQVEKISGPLGGGVPWYRKDHRIQGGRMDADPFRYLQYPNG